MRRATCQRIASVGWLVIVLMGTTTGRACLTCESDTAQQVRAELADEHLPVSVAATVLPFVVVAGVVALVHFGPTVRRR